MNQQRQLPNLETPSEIFKRIYYRLYSNSEASRAETILANISLLLLVFFELSASTNGRLILDKYLTGTKNSDDLLKACRKQDPDLIESSESFSISESLLREIFVDLASIDIEQASHIMGDAFQALMGPRLRGDKGQFFTPRSLIKAIVEIAQPHAGSTIVDPACGTAGFLAESAAYAERAGHSGIRLVGRDKDRDLARLARAVVRITSKNTESDVNVANSLDLTHWSEESFDFVLTNPPFGAKIGIDDPALLRQYDLGHKAPKETAPKRGRDPILASQDPQILFIELCVRLLKPGGLMGVVLPEGVFGNRQTAFVWEWLSEHGSVEALLDCPRTTFQPGTDTKTNVLFFRKSAKQSRKIRVGVALKCGHDRRGRATLASGAIVPNDFERIGSDFSKTRNNTWTNVVAPTNNYFVPRYLAMRSKIADLDFGVAADSERTSLGDLIKNGVLRVAKGHEVGSEAYGTGDIPFVRTSDISNLEIRLDSTNGVSEEIYEEYSKLQKLRAGDVLLVVDGRYRIGAAALLSEGNSQIIVQSHIRILQSTNHDRLSPYSLLYSLTLPGVREQMRDLVFIQSTLGTVAPRLSELIIPIIRPSDNAFASVELFKNTLMERDRLLTLLASQSTTEVEL